MQNLYLPRRALQTPLPRVSDLWRRAHVFVENLLDGLTSAARLARAVTLPRDQRTFLHAMIEPLEHLVRSLLLSDTIAWLTTTDEGADIMREEAARRDAQTAAKLASTSAPAATIRSDQRASRAPEPRADPGATRDIEAEIARALDPKRLRFRLTDPECPPHATPATRRDPSEREMTKPDMAQRDMTRRPNAGLRFARRVEALRLIIANPLPMVRILARHLARRHTPPMDVPPPWTPLPDTFGPGARELIPARAIGVARYQFFQKLKHRRDARALPPPLPG